MLSRLSLVNRRTGFKLFSSLHAYDKPIMVLNSPGSRTIELSAPLNGNVISDDTVRTILHNVKLVEGNDTVALMFVTSQSPYKFSGGLSRSSLGIGKELVKSSNNLALALSTMKKESVAVYSGSFDDTAFNLFAGCRYRLGTESTSMAIRIFQNGRLSVGGGLSYHFAQGSPYGVAALRFLSFVERKINAFDMHELGLLTHIVELEPQSSIAHAIAHTLGVRYDTKVEQTLGVDVSELPAILDTMNVFTDDDKLNNIMVDPVWDKIMLVPPNPNEEVEEISYLAELQNYQKEINHCFGVETVAECHQRLSVLADSIPWAKEALVRMGELPENDLKEWFRLTHLATKLSLSKMLEEEELVHSNILQSMI